MPIDKILNQPIWSSSIEIKNKEQDVSIKPVQEESSEEQSQRFFEQNSGFKKPVGAAISSFLDVLNSSSTGEIQVVSPSIQEISLEKNESKQLKWVYTNVEEFNQFITQNPDLEGLVLSFQPSPEVAEGKFDLSGLANLKNLKHLHIEAYAGWIDYPYGKTLPASDLFTLNKQKSLLTLPSIPSLESLKIGSHIPFFGFTESYASRVANFDQLFDHLSTCAPSLKKLDLSNNVFIGESSFKPEGQILANICKLTNLEELNLRHTVSLIGKHTLIPLQNLPKLRMLDFSENLFPGNSLITAEILKPLFSISSLTSLNLSKSIECTGTKFMYRPLELSLEHLSQLPPLVNLKHLSLGKIDVKDFNRALDLFPHLQTLDLTGVNLETFNCQLFAQWADLESLSLSKVKLSRENKEQLSMISLSSLKKLDLSHTDSHGYFQISSFAPHLVELNLAFSNVTSGDVKKLALIKNLEKLNLSNTKISSASIKFLSKLDHLRSLDLKGTNLWDADFSAFSHLTSLEELNLDEADLSVNSFLKLGELAGLKVLRIANLKNQNITPALIAQLKQKLPHIQVIS